MTASEARPEYRLCSLVSKANGDDPIGSASSFERYLIVEVKEPWEEDVMHSRHFPRPLLEISKRVESTGNVLTLGSSGTGALNEVKQYRLSRLQKIT